MKANDLFISALVVAPAVLLAACNGPSAAPSATDMPAANVAASVEPKTATSEGAITAIDQDTGKITLAHGPVAELSWPAMTMGFGAKQGQLGDLKVGDKVRFTFRWDGKTAEIESIEKI